MHKRVVITGLGVVSSIGIGWKEFWGNLLDGRSGISPVTSFDTANHFTHNGGEVRDFRAENFIPGDRLPFMNRATQMVVVTVRYTFQLVLNTLFKGPIQLANDARMLIP